MTRKEALTDLLEKVKAGEFTPEPGGAVMPAYRRFTALADVALPQDVRALNVLAHDAYKGSLDAALALHEAVLPGWSPGVSENIHGHGWYGFVQNSELKDFTAISDTPARAWLIAIISALISQEGDQ